MECQPFFTGELIGTPILHHSNTPAVQPSHREAGRTNPNLRPTHTNELNLALDS
jgi:hypothetical protein